MGLKKYEIITVGSDKRVRALRSWAVGDRYVNIGDVGGIVYDEKTLSQDGLCWLFRGNFGFPGARIGGDSIVDVGEATPPAGGSPAVDILGSSVVAGAKLIFESETTAADAVVLTADDFEQGYFGQLLPGTPLTLAENIEFVRLKKSVFSGGKPVTIKCDVPGYAITAVAVDRDNIIITNAPTTQSGEGVVITVPAGQYFNLYMSKSLWGVIVPADAAAAQITFTGTYETSLSIIDSRVEINPATSTGATVIRPGGLYSFTPGAKYPDSVIRNSKVAINGHAMANRTVRFISEFTGCNVAIDTTTGGSQGVGIHSSVKNLTFTGVVTTNWNVAARSIIQANDCDNFAVSSTIFPGIAAAQTANVPFIFQGCNVPNGLFYHHAQIKNTYVNIDFAKAQADLGKAIASGEVLASSEVEGMYRLYSTTGSLFGALAEAHDSVKSLNMTGGAATYGTTIYKDAYFNGLFDFAGTNVFGNTMKHDTQDVSGCKIVNTGATAVNMKGNIRVEGNATLTNCSIIGSGYFGGNSVVHYNPTVWASLDFNGTVYMKDNAVFAPIEVIVGTNVSSLDMRDNAVFAGSLKNSAASYNVTMADEARCLGTLNNSRSVIIMRGNSFVAAASTVAPECRGLLVIEDDARIENGDLRAVGHITICGKYKQTAFKTWTGKRVIDNENAPEYDNNVKTQYDF